MSLLKECDRLTVQQYHDEILLPSQNHILIDVRSEPEMDICKLDNSINFPLNDLLYNEESIDKIKELLQRKQTNLLITLCRKGNDSQKAVQMLCNKLDDSVVIKDIKDGLNAWTDHIDPNFPKY